MLSGYSYIFHSVSLRYGILCEEIDEYCFDDLENRNENCPIELVEAEEIRNRYTSMIVY